MLSSHAGRITCIIAFIIIVAAMLNILLISEKNLYAASPKEDSFTLTFTFSADAVLLNEPSIWLGGLVIESDQGSQPATLELQWVKDQSLWIPRWDLQIVAAPGLLPTELISHRGEASDTIILQEGLPPVRDHLYEVQLAHDPQSGTLSFMLVNTTNGTELFAGQLQLHLDDALLPPATSVETLKQDHIASFQMDEGYRPLGLPLPMIHDFRWEWVRVTDDGFTEHVGFRFSDSETPGIRLHWPHSDVRGTVLFSIKKDNHQYVTVRAVPQNESPFVDVIPLNITGLPLGDFDVDVSFLEGGTAIPMSGGRLRIERTEMTAAYNFLGRIDEAQVGVDLTLHSDSDLSATSITIVATYERHDQADLSQRQSRTVDLIKNDSVTERFYFPVPTSEGSITFQLHTDTSAKLMGGEDRFAVAPTPAFTVRPIHNRLVTALNEPAVLLPNDAYPDLRIYTSISGTLEGIVLHDGIVIDSIPKRFIQAQTEHIIHLEGSPPELGRYEVRLKLVDDHRTFFDALHFSVLPDFDHSPGKSSIVLENESGQLQYVSDIKGNQIPDFSRAGYMGSGIAIPDVPVKVIVEPGSGDDTDRIQAAIDQVAKLPPNDAGMRGAVLLKRGTYEIGSEIEIKTSGIVLRGEGPDDDGTILIATGTTPYNLIHVRGARAHTTVANSSRQITDLYVPVGATSLHVEHTHDLKPGDTVIIRRHGNAAWIQEIGMDRILPRPDDPSNTVQWQPFYLDFERAVTAVDGNRVTVDAPIMNAIDAKWGGGELFKINDTRISQVGVENLKAISQFDDAVQCTQQRTNYACDENHAQYLVSFTNVKDAWLRNAVTVHFAHGPAYMATSSKHITVQDAQSLDPISTIDGSRRYAFHMNGQLNLVQRVYSDGARHAFVFGARVTGPNVFLYSQSENDHNWSEPHHRWSVGGLYDNITAPIYIQDRQWYGTGHGWSGAYYVTWNTVGDLVVQQPPTAQNWAIGHVGSKPSGAFFPRKDGHWESFGEHVTPESLYLKQLQDRLGDEAVKAIGYSFRREHP